MSLRYRDYERRRLGGSRSELSGIVYMTRKALLASSFAGFWRYWNPLFSFYLMTRVLRPLRDRGVPLAISQVLTFAVSGLVHDVAATMVLRRLVCIVTPTFVLYAAYVLVEQYAGWTLKRWPRAMRPLYHMVLLTAGYLTVRFVRDWLTRG